MGTAPDERPHAIKTVLCKKQIREDTSSSDSICQNLSKVWVERSSHHLYRVLIDIGHKDRHRREDGDETARREGELTKETCIVALYLL